MEFGEIKKYTREDNKITIEFENQIVIVEVINDYIINFFSPLCRKERNSKAVENIKYDNCNVSCEYLDGFINIKTSKIDIKIYNDFKVDIYDSEGDILCSDYRGPIDPFKRRNGNIDKAKEEGHEVQEESLYKVYVSKKMEDDMHFYGFGERPGSIDKKDCHYINWNTDNPAPHGETFLSLYKSVPFFIALKGTKAFGIFFDNYFKTHFDMGRDNSNYYYFAAEGGNLDYYFIYGPSIKKVEEGYTSLTGRVNLPQIWTLGYQQSRWSYGNEDRLMEVAEKFRSEKIPCDVLYLDIDYMDGYRVFTWDKSSFKNPKKMIEKLNTMGFKVVTIIDPGIKKEVGYKIYDEGSRFKFFALDENDKEYVNRVWAGDSVFPDFLNTRVREWWARNQSIMTNFGVSGIWNDMNEPASFNGPLPDNVFFSDDGLKVNHKEAHNIYGHLMCKATYEGLKLQTGKRPFVVTRACYSGTQKYAVVWTGDNQSTWEHLRMAIPMLLNLGLSGFAFCGTDVGGFGHDCTGELLCRWVQLGAFTPLFRNHSALGTRDQEPWAFDEKTENINRKYIELRYKLIPYFYDLFRIAEKDGSPIMRPLFYEYQSDKRTYDISDEFLVGDSILVAPIVEKGKRRRIVYIPHGSKWIDYWSGEEYEGGQYIVKSAPLDTCIMFVKEGAIIPLYEKKQNYIGEDNNIEVTFDIYFGDEEKKSSYINYLDDGESFNYKNDEYNKYLITAESTESKVYIEFKNEYNGYIKTYNNVHFKLHNLNGRSVILNGQDKGVVRKLSL